MKTFKYVKRLVYLSVAGFGGFCTATIIYPTIASYCKNDSHKKCKQEEIHKMNAPLPTREELINGINRQELDVLVIGGGATGLGVALDATTRGLRTGLVEKSDFSSGTSSRSTKLIHGGVRYLQKAIINLDGEQYTAVKDALAERANMINLAPHLAYPLPIMLPVYQWWQVPYYWAGIKMYDFVAGSELLKPSYLISKSKALEFYPMLKKDELKAALVYYDGQFNDARMTIALALTAIRHGAFCLNYTLVESLIKTTVDGEERISGARVRNTLTGEEYNIRAKCVINATGHYTDIIRTMGDRNVEQICQPSSGVHIVLPDYYSPSNMGLLDPSTSDGRVIFFLPWENVTVTGSTDKATQVMDNPQPTEEEIQFILNEIRDYLSPEVEIRLGDVLSAWSGIRPLLIDLSKSDTQYHTRNHIIEVAKNKLITIAGGKLTTYRSMAEQTVTTAVEACGLTPSGSCRTKGILLDGAHGWSPTLFIRLVQDFGLENAVAQHLARTYGDKAFKVAKLSSITGKRWPIVGKRLHKEYPYIEAEVKYAIQEYTYKAIDMIARRTRLSFINVHAAQEALPKIIDMMAVELGWNEETKKREKEEAETFLCNEMGKSIIQGDTCDVCPGHRKEFNSKTTQCGSMPKVPPPFHQNESATTTTPYRPTSTVPPTFHQKESATTTTPYGPTSTVPPTFHQKESATTTTPSTVPPTFHQKESATTTTPYGPTSTVSPADHQNESAPTTRGPRGYMLYGPPK